MEEKAIELKAEVLKAMAQPTRLKILECLREGREMHLRNCAGDQWRTVQYFPAYFRDAEEPPDHHAERRGQGDGEGPGSKDL